MNRFNIEPGSRLATSQGDESTGSLQEFDPSLVVNGRLKMTKEGDIRCCHVTYTMHPQQRTPRPLIGKSQGAIPGILQDIRHPTRSHNSI